MDVQTAGNFSLAGVDGRLQRVTPQQHQQRVTERLLAGVPSLADFRARWLDPARRRERIDELAGQGLVPTRVREAAGQEDYDLFDILAALAYGTERWPRRRLGDLLSLQKNVVRPRDRPRVPATFVGLEHVESGTGRRLGTVEVAMEWLTGRKPSFRPGEIVHGYLRPYLNKV